MSAGSAGTELPGLGPRTSETHRFQPKGPPGSFTSVFPRFCRSAARYSARWSHESQFSKILIGPKMLTDHMPDILMKALDSVVSGRAGYAFCPAGGGSNVDVV